MRTSTAQWFEIIVRYDKTMEDGQQKKVTEVYTVDAMTFGEAEKRITEEMGHFISGDFSVKNINPAPYGEIFFSDQDKSDKWYKAKLQFITIDEKKGKERKSNVCYLVQASNIENARKNIDGVMRRTTLDYAIASIVETKIMDVFEYNKEDNA